MKKILAFFSVFFLCMGSWAYAGIPGATDKVPASTLVVPFLEVGIDVATHPHDTHVVVTNEQLSPVIIHYEVWDIDGNIVNIYGNETLSGGESWPVSMRSLISSASGSAKAALTQGSYYRGFMTIDTVTAETEHTPLSGSYPFSTANNLEGYIYYVRLLEGSSNGMDAIPIEYVGHSVETSLQDFYQNDGKEEIDSAGRACAAVLAKGGTACAPYDGYIDRFHSRVFLDPTYNASSRIIVFTWDPGRTGGPSVYCDTEPSCPSTYTYKRYDEAGSTLQDTTIRLDHAVNVIDVSGTQNGSVSIWDVTSNPTGLCEFQVYAFSINSANPPPAVGINANWDAIFESYIIP